MYWLNQLSFISNETELSKILILIGGLVAVIQAAISLIGAILSLNLVSIVLSIIGIIMGLIAIGAAGFISLPPDLKALTTNWIVILILGILLLIFNSWIGGILVIIGAILMVLKN